ncbi:glycosyltransferase family 4 protein [Paenimyroides baculatum]|uniref:Glycosyltransferase family 4 protein n=1 Tax=Paenimyroides baculatum TaxID=2608000 RepID=A0A5M6CJJ4_9FLAO|nr:glycosyltransferase family 4 protein [Paenimyroides baculatum]KAA5535388.1 glycosyltransferase family 4 protein [Paenimyroides baculatum]
MRFVHVEDFVHPNAGYQLNLLGRLQVKQGHEVIIVTSELDNVPDFLVSFFGKDNILEKDEKYFKETGVKILRYPTYTWYSSRAIFKTGLHKFIKSLNPDVLFIHGEDTLTGMKLLMSYKSMNMPFVLDCHMLEMASKNKFSNYFRKFFRKFITPIILKNEIPLIRVVDSDFVEKHFAIPLEKTHLLSFGTDTDYFKANIEHKHNYRKELGFSDDEFIVLYAGKLDIHKGGTFLAKAIEKKFDLPLNTKLRFVIVSTTSDNEYGREVDTILSKSENLISRFPTQTYSDLEKFYKLADIAVFPRQCSMSYFEVQSCSLPVILEENEINVERASHKKGLIFKDSNIEDFRSKIIEFVTMNPDEFELYRLNARENILKNYDYIPIAQKFTNVMIEEYKRFYSK